jgi:hypothetical protein
MAHFQTSEFPCLGQDQLVCNVHQDTFRNSAFEPSLYDLCKQARRILGTLVEHDHGLIFSCCCRFCELHVKDVTVVPAGSNPFYTILCHDPTKEDSTYDSGFLSFIPHLQLENFAR